MKKTSLLFFVKNITCLNLVVSISLTVLFFVKNSSIYVELCFLKSTESVFNSSLMLDSLGLIFLTVLNMILFCILWFTDWYLFSHLYKSGFTAVLFLFVNFMTILIIAANFYTLILGWDGLGITSFLLVLFYGDNKAGSASMSTAMSNRVGDCFLLSAIVLGTMENMAGSSTMPLISVFFLLAASLTKSAQLPFSSWLTEAMEAPTPVSALVHSSTLITAGVFLVIRFFFLLTPGMLKALLFLSSLTAATASWSSFFSNDAKKLVALSTLTQVSTMFFVVSLGEMDMGFIHLITHAFSKALTFIMVGSFMVLYGTKNFTKTKNIFYSTPLLSSMVFLSNLAMSGLPVLALGSSKEASCLKILSGGGLPVFFSLLTCFFCFSSYYTLRKIFSLAIMNKSVFTPPLGGLPIKEQMMTFFFLVSGSSWTGMNSAFFSKLSDSSTPLSGSFILMISSGACGYLVGLESSQTGGSKITAPMQPSFFFSLFDLSLLQASKNIFLNTKKKFLESFLESLLTKIGSLFIFQAALFVHYEKGMYAFLLSSTYLMMSGMMWYYYL